MSAKLGDPFTIRYLVVNMHLGYVLLPKKPPDAAAGALSHVTLYEQIDPVILRFVHPTVPQPSSPTARENMNHQSPSTKNINDEYTYADFARDTGKSKQTAGRRVFVLKHGRSSRADKFLDWLVSG